MAMARTLVVVREGRVKRRRAGKSASNADWPRCCGDYPLSWPPCPIKVRRSTICRRNSFAFRRFRRSQ